MRQNCVCCVVGPMLFVKYIQMTFGVVEFIAIAYATCFVGKVCSPTWSTGGASPERVNLGLKSG